MRDAREQLQVLVFGDDEIVSRCSGVCRDREEREILFWRLTRFYAILPQGDIGLDVKFNLKCMGIMYVVDCR